MSTKHFFCDHQAELVNGEITANQPYLQSNLRLNTVKGKSMPKTYDKCGNAWYPKFTDLRETVFKFKYKVRGVYL